MSRALRTRYGTGSPRQRHHDRGGPSRTEAELDRIVSPRHDESTRFAAPDALQTGLQTANFGPGSYLL
jgi:hypothetical protein